MNPTDEMTASRDFHDQVPARRWSLAVRDPLVWAFETTTANAESKLALILIANLAGHAGFVAEDGLVEYVSAHGCMPLKSARRTLASLVSGGYLSRRIGTQDGFNLVQGYRFPDEAIHPNNLEDYRSVIAEKSSPVKTSAKRQNIYSRDNHACVYCGSTDKENFVLDHVVPRCQGGGNDASNLATACRDCNSKKGGRTPEQWRAAQ